MVKDVAKGALLSLKANFKSTSIFKIIMNCRFSYDAMLNTNGDTAVYLLYGHARIASILKKAETTKGISIKDLKEKHSVQARCL